MVYFLLFFLSESRPISYQSVSCVRPCSIKDKTVLVSNFHCFRGRGSFFVLLTSSSFRLRLYSAQEVTFYSFVPFSEQFILPCGLCKHFTSEPVFNRGADNFISTVGSPNYSSFKFKILNLDFLLTPDKSCCITRIN